MRAFLLVLIAAVGALFACGGSDPALTPAPVAGGPGPTFLETTTVALPLTGGPSPQELQCEARARNVHIAYQPERTMTVGRQEQIEVLLTLDTPADVNLPGNGTIVVSDALLGCEIEARLIGGSAFDVDPEGSIEASFMAARDIRFDWIVTPLQVGPSVLQLQVESIVRLPGYEYPTAPRAFAAAIAVEAAPESTFAKITRWSGDLVDFPLVKGAGVLAAAAAVYAGWAKRFRRKDPSC